MGFYAHGLSGQPQPRLAVEWEEPRCLLCQGGESSVLIEAPDPLPGSGGLWFAVTQCQDCGLCYTNPRPSAETIGVFYSNGYPPYRQIPARCKRRWHWLLSRGGRRKFLERLPLQGSRRLLDFGCGNGSYLLRMHQRGWSVTGLDSSERTVQRIRAELGLRVLAGTLPHNELEGARFDVVTMRHSLEHVHQPLDVLRAAHRLLTPDGKLVVATPNIDSLPFKWFGRHWRGLDLPRHITHFTPDTLQLMLGRAGFEIGSVRMIRHPAWVRRSARQASRRSGAPMWQQWLRGRLAASLATWYAFWVRRCDAMVVTAYKGVAPDMDAVSAFSGRFQESPRFPGGRWHNR